MKDKKTFPCPWCKEELFNLDVNETMNHFSGKCTPDIPFDIETMMTIK